MPPKPPPLRRGRLRGPWEQLLRSRATDDEDLLWAGRLGAALIVLASALLQGVYLVLSDSATVGYDPVVSWAVMAFGIGAFFFPWDRFPRRTLLVLPLSVFVGIAVGGIVGGGPIEYYLAVVPLPLLYTGLTQNPGTVLALTPAAVVATVIGATSDGWTAVAAMNLAISIPMSVIIGEYLAVVRLRQRETEEGLTELLEGIRALDASEEEEGACDLVVHLAARFVGSDIGVVLVSADHGARGLVARSASGHPAVVGTMSIDLDSEESGIGTAMRTGRSVLVKDLRASAIGSTRVADELGVGGGLFVPLPGSAGSVGVVALYWRDRAPEIPTGVHREVELLAEQAGRTLERLRATARLTQQADTDPLTGLANRRTFSRALQRIEPGDAVAILDLDRFKAINDRDGHEAGDRALQQMARCLREMARERDCVARYGGEEFATVLVGAGAGGARSALERVRDAWNEAGGPTSFSAGIAVSRSGELPGDTLRRADASLYSAKARGRDRIVVSSFTEGAEVDAASVLR